ncbi:MAG: amidase [Planctomycetota bacterium]
MTRDQALRVGPRELLRGSEEGPLAGRRFVVKDNLDVAGERTGCGQPEWLADALPAARTAPAVERLVAAGAILVGKAHQTELAFGLSGQNLHYGTPPNPAAPGRDPGGSSSGSASAVASGIVDFALGSDTGGSVRVPASYCGILGFRPTHGRIPTAGLVPLSPSFDTVSWFARDAALLEAVGSVLLDPPHLVAEVRGLVLAADALLLADAEAVEPLRAAGARLAAALGVPLTTVEVAGGEGGLGAWYATFAAIQMPEAWEYFGPWITRRAPRLAPEIAARFEQSRRATAAAAAAGHRRRAKLRARVEELTAGGRLLALPAAVGPAPPLDPPSPAVREAEEDRRGRLLPVTSIAGIAGAPAVSLPVAKVDGLPLGLCLVGPPGGDETLLAIAARALGGDGLGQR